DVLSRWPEKVTAAGGQPLLRAIGINQYALFEVEHAPAHAHAWPNGCRHRTAGAPQHALNSGEQFAWVECVENIVVGAVFEADDAVARVARRRHHDYADLAALLAQPSSDDE